MADLIIKPSSGNTLVLKDQSNTARLTIDTSGRVIGVGGLKSRQVFTASGTWTKPTGISTILVQVQGSGGGGGKWQNGGGSGGYGEKLIDVTSISSVAVTISEPGAGAVNPQAAAGVTSFGSHVTANGARNYTIQTNSPGRGAEAGSGGDINTAGGGGVLTHDGSNNTAAAGGPSYFGGASAPRYDSTPADSPTDGGAYGTGGAGADGSGDGGNGMKGIVIVSEYS